MTARNKQIILITAGLCLTVGLAPFTPEPHIWGKLKWIAGGAEGMQLMDWLDVAFHGSPWVYLVWRIIRIAPNKL
jgi:hypothetical protein